MTIRTLAVTLISLAGMSTALGATNTWQPLAGPDYNGDWSSANRWSLSVVPGTTDHTDDDVAWGRTSGAGPWTLTLDNDDMDLLQLSSMNVRSLVGEDANGADNVARQVFLEISGASNNRLELNVGNVDNNPATAILAGKGSGGIKLQWVDLTVVGTPTLALSLQNHYNSTDATFAATDSNITMQSVNGGDMNGVVIGGNKSRPQATMSLTRGSLTVTNNSSNAYINVGAIAPDAGVTPTLLSLSDTLLTTNNMTVSNEAAFIADNSQITDDSSSITGTLSLAQGGDATFNGGKFTIGSINTDLNSGTVPGSQVALTVNDGELTVGNINFSSTLSDVRGPMKISLNGGSTHVTDNVNLGGTGGGPDNNNPGVGWYEMTLANSASLAVDGTMLLGAIANGRHASGTLTMIAGTLEVNNLITVGIRNGNINSEGYYNQTGGGATITGTLTLATTVDASEFATGTAQFVVGAGTTMTITGAGFAKLGSAAWNSTLLSSGNLSFAGSFIFDPTSPQTQTLLAFGEDLGTHDPDGPTAVNYRVGTLDLSGLDSGGEKLSVVAAGNFATNALYIDTLLGLDTTVDGGGDLLYLDSALNLYYDAYVVANAYLGGQTYSLAGGGSLAPVPEPSSTLVVCGAAAFMLSRRRRLRA